MLAFTRPAFAQPACGTSTHSCYVQGGAGCCNPSNPGCCATVCAVDSFCCNTSWDSICVNEAVTMCGPQPASVCGNACVEAGEQCDDGNNVDGDGCNANCIVEFCGDGITQMGLGEQCDDGNTINGDGCDVNCTLTGCGNGVVDPTEACDDGNMSNNDACLINCTPNVCGDGFENVGVEECDDANNVSSDGCSATCQDEAALSLDIINPQECYMAGDQVCVQLNMDLQPGQSATGFAAFLEYDPVLLTYLPGASSYNNPPDNCASVNPAMPFPLHIQGIATSEVASGQINLDGSSPFPGCPLSGGTMTDATLATLCFSVDTGNNGAMTNIGFRTVNQIPPFSRVSFQGNPQPTNLYESDSFTIDQEAPMLTCPPDLSGRAFQCDEDVPPPAMNLAQLQAQGGDASDNCGPPPTVTWEGDTVSGTCPKVIMRHYQATDSAGNMSTCTQTITVQDLMPPVVTEVPATTNVQCPADVPPPFANYAQFAAAGGAVAENCDPNLLTLTLVQQLASGSGCPTDPRLVARLYTICDACNNCDTFKHLIVVVDNTPPSITCPPNAGFQCAAQAPPAASNLAEFQSQGGSVSDNCGGPVTVTLQSESNNGGAGCPASPLVITRVYRATDSCGNTNTCTQTLTASDTTAPVVTPPANITTNADAGGCTALVSFAAAASDNCGGSPTIVYKIGMTVITSPHDFPQGTTTVTVEATDSCGNTGTGSFTVTVLAQNSVTATVVLEGVNASMAPVTRCIHFVAKGGGECAAAVDVPNVSFSGNPATATNVTFLVPCGAYTSMCAKDEHHTLWDTQSMTDTGTTYQVNAPLFLRAGDTDNDGDVDINDATLLIFQFGGPEPAPGCPFNAANRGADFSDNGNVGSEDYSLLSLNWLTQSFCLCGEPIMGGGPDGADDQNVQTRVASSALPADVAARADLNGDGVIDAQDVEQFERSRGLGAQLSSKLRDLEARRAGRAPAKGHRAADGAAEKK
jgi:cysteine-rich repeat protein